MSTSTSTSTTLPPILFQTRKATLITPQSPHGTQARLYHSQTGIITEKTKPFTQQTPHQAKAKPFSEQTPHQAQNKKYTDKAGISDP